MHSSSTSSHTFGVRRIHHERLIPTHAIAGWPVTLCMALYGLITLLQGFVQSFNGLVATRFFLGLAECGSLPATYYIIAMWYTLAEAQKRYSFLFSSSSLAGAFGGLLASAIGQMDGVGGYGGWRWLFIVGQYLPRRSAEES